MGSVSSGRGVSSNSEVVYTGTFAGVPSAVGRTGQLVQFTDVNNSFWYSNGTNWEPIGNRVTVWKNTYPAFNPGSGTISASGSGNITLTTALPAIFNGGVWLYLPTIATTPAITAGWYPCIMSSTTVGTVGGSSNALPSNTFSTTPITFSVGAGYTGDLNEITHDSYSIPANLLRQGCIVKGEYDILKTSGTSAVVPRSRFNSTQINTTTAGFSSTSLNLRWVSSANIISTTTSLSMAVGANSYQVSTNANVADTGLNLAATIPFALTLDTATATDNCGVVSSIIEIIYP